MLGWNRDFSPNYFGAMNEGDHNKFVTEPLGDGTMKGVLFDRNRVQSLRSEGLTLRQMADKLGVNRGLVHKTLAEQAA